jgi:hypothetical protein
MGEVGFGSSVHKRLTSSDASDGIDGIGGGTNLASKANAASTLVCAKLVDCADRVELSEYSDSLALDDSNDSMGLGGGAGL